MTEADCILEVFRVPWGWVNNERNM